MWEERLPIQALQKPILPIAPCSYKAPTLLPLQNRVPVSRKPQNSCARADSKHKPHNTLPDSENIANTY